jgi:hypothetical protein
MRVVRPYRSLRRQALAACAARDIDDETSGSEAKALADEGIAVARIPWVPPHDA